jgi:hypothetical protein
MTSIDFATFADGPIHLRRAACRIAQEANQSGQFGHIFNLNYRDLISDISFADHRFIRNSPRGFGFWLWKPILFEKLLGCNGAEVIAYADAGCVLNLNERAQQTRLADYAEYALDHGVCTFSLELPEQAWCKADTSRFFGLSPEQVAANQTMATVLLFARSTLGRSLVETWLDTCLRDDHHLLDDSPSLTPNHQSFVEHRHDQAVLSCLLKREGIPSLPDETYFPDKWTTDGRDFPIWTARHKLGTNFEPRGDCSPVSQFKRVFPSLERRIAERFYSHSSWCDRIAASNSR